MRISTPTSTVVDGRARVSATVVWEDCGWREREVYFETDLRFVDDLTPNPNAFLLAAIIPAMHFGEHRIFLEGPLCPQLRDGLASVMQQFREWYGETNRLVTIESATGFAPSQLPAAPRTASLMSGGVDSLATFRQNRIDFPLSHPGAIKDVIFIHGFDMGGHKAWDSNVQSFESAQQMLSKMAEEAGATLIPIYSNMRWLEEDSPGLYYTDIFVLKSFAACLAAAGHALSRRITTLLIPSSHVVGDLEPWGSHPLIDPNYSSASLSVRHDGLSYSRLSKMQLVCEWQAGLQSLRVCADPLRPAGIINCGQCEKCLRTMIALLVFGKLDECTTFEANDVTQSLIESLRWTLERKSGSLWAFVSGSSAPYWRQFVAPLREMNRDDLADAIVKKLKEYDRIMARLPWLARAKWLDKKLMWNTMSRVRRAIRNRRA